MANARPVPDELCALIEKEKTELWPEYALLAYVTAKLDEANETVVIVKAYSSRDFARQAAAKDRLYYFPLFKEPKTGAKWPSTDEIWDYITY